MHRRRRVFAAEKEEALMPVKAPTVPTKVLVQVRLSDELVKDVDHLSIEWGLYRNETMERLLREALDTYKKQGSLWAFSTP